MKRTLVCFVVLLTCMTFPGSLLAQDAREEGLTPEATARMLADTRVTRDGREVKLADLVVELDRRVACPVVLDPRALVKGHRAADVPVSRRADNVPMDAFLRDLVASLGLRVHLVDEIVLLTDREEIEDVYAPHPEARDVPDRLARTRMTASFRNAPLRDVAWRLREATGIPVNLLDTPRLKDTDRLTLSAENMSARHWLNWTARFNLTTWTTAYGMVDIGGKWDPMQSQMARRLLETKGDYRCRDRLLVDLLAQLHAETGVNILLDPLLRVNGRPAGEIRVTLEQAQGPAHNALNEAHWNLRLRTEVRDEAWALVRQDTGLRFLGAPQEIIGDLMRRRVRIDVRNATLWDVLDIIERETRLRIEYDLLDDAVLETPQTYQAEMSFWNWMNWLSRFHGLGWHARDGVPTLTDEGQRRVTATFTDRPAVEVADRLGELIGTNVLLYPCVLPDGRPVAETRVTLAFNDTPARDAMHALGKALHIWNIDSTGDAHFLVDLPGSLARHQPETPTEALGKLRKVRVDLDFGQTPLAAIVPTLTQKFARPVVLDLADARRLPQPVRLKVRKMRAVTVLDALAVAHDLTWTVRGDAVVLTDRYDSTKMLIEYSLDETIVRFTFNEQDIADALEFLGTIGNINILLDPRDPDAGEIKVSLSMHKVTLRDALEAIARQTGRNLVVADGAVVLTKRQIEPVENPKPPPPLGDHLETKVGFSMGEDRSLEAFMNFVRKVNHLEALQVDYGDAARRPLAPMKAAHASMKLRHALNWIARFNDIRWTVEGDRIRFRAEPKKENP